MQPTARDPTPIPTPQTLQAKFLEEVATKGDKVSAQELNEIFKRSVPNEKLDVKNYSSLSAYNIRDQIYRQNSTAGLEGQIKGSLIALRLAYNNTSRFQFEKRNNIQRQIDELVSLQGSSPGKILMAKLAKKVDETDKALLMKLRDPQLAKDFDNIIEIYGSKRAIPLDVVKLVIKLRDADPNAFSEGIQKAVLARRSNIRTLNENNFINPRDKINQDAILGLQPIKAQLPNVFDPAEDRTNLNKVTSFIHELTNRSLESVSQLHHDTIVFAIDPNDEKGKRTRQATELGNESLDRHIQAAKRAPQDEGTRKTIEALEKMRNYYYNERANHYEKAEWKKEEGSDNVYLRTIGFKSLEGDVKDTPVRLDLSKFKDVDQLAIFKFLQEANHKHDWVNEFDKSHDPKVLPKDVRTALDNIKTKDVQPLSEARKNELIGIAAKFTREMYIDYYKKIFTLGVSSAELDRVSNASPGEVLLHKAAKSDPSILLLMSKDPALVSDFNHIVEIYGAKRTIPTEMVQLLIKLRQTDPEKFSDSIAHLKVNRERNLGLLQTNQLAKVIDQTDELNRAARRSMLDLQDMILNIVEDEKSPEVRVLQTFFNALLSKSQLNNSQVHQDTILYAVNPDLKNQQVMEIKRDNAKWDEELQKLEKEEISNPSQKQELEKKKEYYRNLKDYHSNEFSDIYQKASWTKVPGTSNDWVRTIGLRSKDPTVPFTKENELVFRLPLSEFADVNQQDLFDFIRIVDGNPNWAKKSELLNLSPEAKVALDKLNLDEERKERLVDIVAGFTHVVNLEFLRKQLSFGD